MAKTKRVTHLKEFIKNSTLASYGVASFAKEECNGMVNTLIELGKINHSDGERLLNNLTERINLSKQVFEEKINQISHKTLELLEKSCEEEIVKLEGRIHLIEKRISNVAQYY